MGRTCSRCKTTFDDIEKHFDRNRAQSGGFSHYCKQCKRATYTPSEATREKGRVSARLRMRAVRESEPEKIKERKRRDYLKHRERVLAKDAKYRASNKQKIRERTRAYHEANKSTGNAKRRALYHARNETVLIRQKRRANPERHRKVLREYRRNNPDKVRFFDKAKCANRGKALGKCTADDIRERYRLQDGKCHWCDKDVGNEFHVDHLIPLSRGGTKWPDNIVISCPPCNMRKHCLLPHEWAARCAQEY